MAEKRQDIGMKSRKDQFSEWFSEIIAKTELADLRYNIKGFLVFRPWSVLSMKEMYRLYEKELESRGHMPAWFPAVIPEENFRKEGEHIEGFAPELFWITHSGSEKLTERMALRPTSETAMYNMYSMWIRSWRDLPLKIYQSCQVWRCDTKATRPFIRSREFHWIEGHDVFETEEESRKQVEEDMKTTEKVMHLEFGIPFLPFQRPEWDKFPGAVHTYTADTLMPDGKALQQPSTHLLGQNFSKTFGIKFFDRNEKEKHAWQTCYGPCISRIFASVIAMHGDDKGLIFPFKIAPVQVIIIPIGNNNDVLNKAESIRQGLVKDGIRAEVDKSDNTPGWKFNQWELKGVPLRIEIGPRELGEGKVTITRRDTGEKTSVEIKKITFNIMGLASLIQHELLKRADSWFKTMIHQAGDFDDLREKLDKGGFVRVEFCSIGMDGKPCAERIKEELHAEVRGERVGKKEKPAGKCVCCKKKAGVVVYVAKQY